MQKKLEEDIPQGTLPDYLFPRYRPFYFSAAGHFPPTRFRLLRTHPYSSNLFSIFFTCLPSYHTLTYTRPHTYPASLPNPNITSLTSSFTSSQSFAPNTSTTSSQISFSLFPNSPFSFVRHPHPFKHILSIYRFTALLLLIEIHFNFLGQGTLSPLSPWPTALRRERASPHAKKVGRGYSTGGSAPR